MPTQTYYVVNEGELLPDGEPSTPGTNILFSEETDRQWQKGDTLTFENIEWEVLGCVTGTMGTTSVWVFVKQAKA